MKKYFPSVKFLSVFLFLGLLSYVMYGVPFPKEWVFSELINSHPIGSSIAFIVMITLILAIGAALFDLLERYDTWKNS